LVDLDNNFIVAGFEGKAIVMIWLKVSGISGVIAPIVAFTLILVAIGILQVSAGQRMR